MLIAGCTQDKVVGRYKTAVCVAGDDGVPQTCNQIEPRVNVSVTTIATPGGAAVTLSVNPTGAARRRAAGRRRGGIIAAERAEPAGARPRYLYPPAGRPQGCRRGRCSA